MPKSYIFKDKTRILTPTESDQLYFSFKKRWQQILYKTCLITGMRYTEILMFHRHPGWWIKDRNVIHLKKITKPKSKMKSRYVWLTPNATDILPEFFEIEKLPSVYAWRNLIYRAAERSIGGEGVGVKTTRKTWESWLVVAGYDLTLIALSQGHTETTMLNHYLQLPFTEEEKAEIKSRVAGWGKISLKVV